MHTKAATAARRSLLAKINGNEFDIATDSHGEWWVSDGMNLIHLGLPFSLAFEGSCQPTDGHYKMTVTGGPKFLGDTGEEIDRSAAIPRIADRFQAVEQWEPLTPTGWGTRSPEADRSQTDQQSWLYLTSDGSPVSISDALDRAWRPESEDNDTGYRFEIEANPTPGGPARLRILHVTFVTSTSMHGTERFEVTETIGFAVARYHHDTGRTPFPPAPRI